MLYSLMGSCFNYMYKSVYNFKQISGVFKIQHNYPNTFWEKRSYM